MEAINLVGSSMAAGESVGIVDPFGGSKVLFSGVVDSSRHHVTDHADILYEFSITGDEYQCQMNNLKFDCSAPYDKRIPFYLKINNIKLKMHIGRYYPSTDFFNNQQPLFHMANRVVTFNCFMVSSDFEQIVDEPVESRWDILDIR
jgi:hypothetical protein